MLDNAGSVRNQVCIHTWALQFYYDQNMDTRGLCKTCFLWELQIYVFFFFLLVNATFRRKTEMQFKILSKRHCQEVAFASTNQIHSRFIILQVICDWRGRIHCFLRIIPTHAVSAELVAEGRRCSTSVARASLNIIVLVRLVNSNN